MMFDAHALRSPLDPLNLLTPSRRPISKSESVTVFDGLVFCDHGHVYALADALPAKDLETLRRDQG